MAGQNPTTLYKRYASPAKTYMEKGKKRMGLCQKR